MIFFALEERFGLAPSSECEDAGIEALRQVRTEAWTSAVFLIGISFAVAANDHFLRHYFRPPSRYAPPLLLLTVWAVSTTFSLVTLSLFGRAPISFLFKFVHVACELFHLAFCLLVWRLFTIANFVGMLAVVGLAAAVNMPCRVSNSLTELGAVLDTLNFVVVMLIASWDPVATRVRIAFLLHGTYIWSFLLMAYVLYEDTVASISLRVYGFCANCAAVYVMMLAVTFGAQPQEVYGVREGKVRVLVDKQGTLYSDFSPRGAAFLLFSSVLQGFRRYEVEEGSVWLRWVGGEKELKEVETDASGVVHLRHLGGVVSAAAYSTCLALLFFAAELHWSLVMLYSALLPNGVAWIGVQILKRI